MTRPRIIVIGAGMGGLSAALRLIQQGFPVLLLEARGQAGGLASGLVLEGLPFDGGPYILLDRPGLAKAFDALGLSLDEEVSLRRIEEVYAVSSGDGPEVSIHASLDRTCDGLERAWPGSGRRYREFVEMMGKAFARLSHLLWASPPGPRHLLRNGAWRALPFLARSLGSVLARTGLPRPVKEAIAIWTRVAGARLEEAPSPMAFVPALIHGPGSFVPAGGTGRIPEALLRAAIHRGVEVRLTTGVRAIRVTRGSVIGVETDGGEFLEARAVISNASGIGTYLALIQGELSGRFRSRIEALPLQSPGVCAYLAVRRGVAPPFLRFRILGDGSCRLLVLPATIDPELERGGWRPARLIAPVDHAWAERGGPDRQGEFLENVIGEDWWREPAGEFRVLATRIPVGWGSEFRLWRDSMNPVMTARLLRSGRLAHRSPAIHGLYLAGSSTHPGQWISFTAISGILAADRAAEDLS